MPKRQQCIIVHATTGKYLGKVDEENLLVVPDKEAIFMYKNQPCRLKLEQPECNNCCSDGCKKNDENIDMEMLIENLKALDSDIQRIDFFVSETRQRLKSIISNL